MGVKFNPFTGNLDLIDTTAAAGSDTQVQFNNGGSLAGSADLTWDDTAKELGVGGDINLDDGGTYATTLQLITPTANRTISFPDATGTVGLVGGSSGQLVYNNAGAYAGAPNSSVGATGNITLSLAGAASTPPVSLTGAWFSGGTSTTTKPQLLIEPNGTTSTAWSTGGTGLGVNAASGFGGNLLDLQVNGTNQFSVNSAGGIRTSQLIVGINPSFHNIKTTGVTFGIRSDWQIAWYDGPNLNSGGAYDVGLARNQAGVLTITNGSTGTGYLKQTPVAVSALPAAATVGAGTRGFVSDSTVAASVNFGAIVTGGGSNNVPVFSDGTNWLIG